MNLAYFSVGFGISLALTSAIKSLLINANVVRPNFRNEKVPVSMGIVFVLAMVSLGLLTVVTAKNIPNNFIHFTMGLVCVGFLGLLDDLIGNRNDTGLKGHFKKLLQGELTTGALKALGIGCVSLFLALTHDGFYGVYNTDIRWLGIALIKAIIISLSANLLNSFDLRPGRACKAFMILSVMLLVFIENSKEISLLWAMLGIVGGYFLWDVRAKVMMGDVGANVLGFSLGYILAFSLALQGLFLVLLFLIAFHYLTENYSLTKIIAENPVLNYIDMLGREKG